jgi:hypothetical protein
MDFQKQTEIHKKAGPADIGESAAAAAQNWLPLPQPPIEKSTCAGLERDRQAQKKSARDRPVQPIHAPVLRQHGRKDAAPTPAAQEQKRGPPRERQNRELQPEIVLGSSGRSAPCYSPAARGRALSDSVIPFHADFLSSSAREKTLEAARKSKSRPRPA